MVLIGAWVQVEGEGEGVRGGASGMSSGSPPLYRVQCCCQTLPVAQCFPAIEFVIGAFLMTNITLYSTRNLKAMD